MIMMVVQMIENAIKELNEEGGGSDEKAISKFILEEYKDLPWAHPAFLNHHLKSLSKTGNLTQNHGKLRISCSPSPVSSSSPTSTYAPSDSSASSQSYVQKRTRKKKKKKKRNYKTKRPRQKKHINARGCDDGEKMKQVFTGQVGSDICLDDGMGEVDIISLLTEDEDEANIIQAQAQVDDQSHLHHTRTQTQQIIVFQHEHEHEQNMGDQDDCSTPTPTTFPEKTKRIRNSRRGKRSESNMNGVDEQVYTDLQRQEQQQESANNKVLFQQNHYCPKPKPKPKPRPRPYRNVVDIYESSSTATRNTN